MFLLALTILFSSPFLFLVYRHLFVGRQLSKIRGPPPPSLWKGHLPDLIGINSLKWHLSLPKEYGGIFKIHGLYGAKQLYVTDPLALHYIVIKDQYTFEETDMFLKGNRIVFGNGLLSSLGEQHKRQRKILNPVFSIAHLRNMVPIFRNIAGELRDVISEKVADGPCELDLLDWMGRAALDFIGQAGLGYKFDALRETGMDEYRDAMKNFVTTFTRGIVLRFTLIPFSDIGPAWIRRWIMDRFPSKDIQASIVAVDIMEETSKTILKEKREYQRTGHAPSMKFVGEGKDIISLLVRANEKSEEKLDDSELLGQMNTFVFAGHDTTSSALSRILHLLSTRPSIQQKLRDEVHQALAQTGDGLTYDQLMALPLMDAICRETLRLYPPAPSLLRTTRKDTVVPLLIPIQSTDGRMLNEVFIPKGTDIVIGIVGANRNEDVWGPDADEWKPERWMQPLPESVLRAKLPGVYSSMMTFLGGGRACIGFKFAELEMKMVLSTLVNSFKFSSPVKEIVWLSPGLLKPYVKGDEEYPQMPLTVEKYRK